MLFTFHFLRFVIGFETRAISAIVFTVEQKTAFQRCHGKCTENEEWK